MKDGARAAQDARAPRAFRSTLTAVVLLALSGCGASSAPSTSSTSSTLTSAGDVRIHGIVTNLTLASCDDVSPTDASDIPITFEDRQGNVVGTTTTAETTLTQSSGYCAATAPYSVTVTRKDLYEASVPGMRSPEKMSYADLERANFTWDLGAEIQVNEGT